MADKFIDQSIASTLRDKDFCSCLIARLEQILNGKTMRFMEVCGTHTVAIFQSGLRSLLPKNVTHLSGPGCPVCVSHEAEIALALNLAEQSDIILATFGDMLRVPGSDGRSLKHAKALGANVEIVYSPMDALKLASQFPDKDIVFLGIGFETTAPTVAASVLSARNLSLENFSVLSMHKLVAPSLMALLEENPQNVDAFLLPGHVAMITGLEPFAFLPDAFGKAAAVGGFEPADILLALCELATQFASGEPKVANVYKRAVEDTGNSRARSVMDQVFQPADAMWRGLGKIPLSGLAIAPQYAEYDAFKKFNLVLPQIEPLKGCQCGNVLKGLISPPKCPLFAKKCSPANPVGPCMVSTEGSCAAYYKYGDY